MNILLVNPPNCGRSVPEEHYGLDSIRQIFRGEPLALEALAGNLTDHTVRILDLKVDPDGLADALTQFQPNLVGITGMTCEANAMVRIAGQVKSQGNAIVVVGGIHASNDPEFFNVPAIDYVVVGLGKASFRQLIGQILATGSGGGIPGVARTDPGKLLQVASRAYDATDLVPERPPAYGLVAANRDQYRLETLGLSMGFAITAFGCPHHCNFCCIEALTGGRYLPYPVEAVVRDIRLLGDVPVIRFVDANTFQDVARAKALCRGIAEAGIQKQFFADVRADMVVRHPEVLREWKQIGLRAVIVGFEEIDQLRLTEMGKGCKADDYRKAIDILHEQGIAIVGDFIISPDYSEHNFELLRRYIRETAIELPILSVLTPLPGTPLYRTMADRIVIRDLDFYTLTNAVVRTRLPEKVFYGLYAELTKTFHRKPAV